MRERIEVVAGIITDGELVLACRRAPGKASAGQWEFPGGKVEPDEFPRAALVRELAEELAIVVEVGDLVDRSVTSVGAIDIDLACYRAGLRGPPPVASTDHDELRWVPRSELGSLGWAAPDLPAVRKLTPG